MGRSMCRIISLRLSQRHSIINIMSRKCVAVKASDAQSDNQGSVLRRLICQTKPFIPLEVDKLVAILVDSG